MQYKLFAFFNTWLPEIPSSELKRHFDREQQQHKRNIDARRDGDNQEEDDPLDEEEAPKAGIVVEPFSYTGGREALLDALNIPKNLTITEVSQKPRLLETLQNVDDALRTFSELETRALMFREHAEERLNEIDDGTL